MAHDLPERENDDQRSVLLDYQPLSPPSNHFNNMPLQIRWEVRRRHPIYQRCWRNALSYQKGLTPEDSKENRTDFIAKLLLGVIGHHCEVIDPATEFEDLDGHQDLHFFWHSGALRPVTNRDLIILMLSTLPKQIRGLFAASLTVNEDMDGPQNPAPKVDATTQWSAQTRDQVLSTWAMMMDPVLDQNPDMPFFYANVGDSERVLKKEFDRLLKHYRKQRGITQTRQKSTAKHLKDLQVWDMREGWQKGHYELSSRRSFMQIAQQLKKPIPTLHSQYRNAFKLITGYSYTRERWLQFVFPMLLDQVLNMQKSAGDQLVNKIKSQRRQGRRTIVRPVSATKLSADHGAEILDYLSASELSPAQDELIELTNKVRGLLAKDSKTTPQMIAQVMGVKTTQESLTAIKLIIDQIQQSSELD